ncbi:MAG: flagellar assembly protein FliX [Alphaproteobacteria bacterium]
MKINKTNAAGKTSGVKKTGKASRGSSGARFETLLSTGGFETIENTGALHNVGGVNALNGILALQEVGDSTSERKKKAKKYGGDLLDGLEDIRMGLLTGGIPENKLYQIAKLVEQKKDYVVEDRKLMDLLGEIEVRVCVELAKLQRKN